MTDLVTGDGDPILTETGPNQSAWKAAASKWLLDQAAALA